MKSFFQPISKKAWDAIIQNEIRAMQVARIKRVFEELDNVEASSRILVLVPVAPSVPNQVQDRLSAVGLVMQAKTLALKSCSANQRWCNVRTKTTVPRYRYLARYS